MTKPKLLPPGLSPHDGGGGPRFGQYLILTGLIIVELAMLTLFGTTFSETMALMGDVYLCDQPVIGALFCAIDEDMTATHLLAWLLAIFCIAVPMAIWNEVFKQNVLADPGLWLSNPTNRVYAIIFAILLVLIVALEAANIYPLVARQSIGGPFQSTDETSAIMELLANNQLLGGFVAILVAIMNTALAFLTIKIAHDIKNSMKGGF